MPVLLTSWKSIDFPKRKTIGNQREVVIRQATTRPAMVRAVSKGLSSKARWVLMARGWHIVGSADGGHGICSLLRG
jgi:hypothetical protein